MNFKTLAFTGLTSIALTACATLGTNKPQLGLLETVQNIEVVPATQSNTARLIRFADKCLIEFEAHLDESTATEQWYFKGDTLLSAATIIEAQNDRTTNQFDLENENTKQNFEMLKKHFSEENQTHCN